MLPAGVPEAEAQEVVERLWRVLDTWDHEGRARLLSFATGLLRLPAAGFLGLTPPFTVEITPVPTGEATAPLPTAHTCVNSLSLPAYASETELERKLTLAVQDGLGGFALR